VRTADNLTTFMCRLSKNLGASTSWNPKGLSRPVMGLLYIYLYLENWVLITSKNVSRTSKKIVLRALNYETLCSVKTQIVYVNYTLWHLLATNTSISSSVFMVALLHCISPLNSITRRSVNNYCTNSSLYLQEVCVRSTPCYKTLEKKTTIRF
jgi:hypothetical protein